MTSVQRNQFLVIIRALGALIVIASALSFLLRDIFSDLNNLPAYAQLLGLTAGTSFLGVLLDRVAGDKRSAHTLFGLGLVMVPINLAALGGFVFVALGNPITWLVVAVALTVNFAVGWLGLRILVPHKTHGLAAALVAGGALLVIPVRDPNLIAAICLSSTIVFCGLDSYFCKNDPSLSKWKGWIARGIVAAPLLLLLGRTALYYKPTVWVMMAVLSAVGWLMWHAAGRIVVREWSVLARVMSLAIAFPVCVLLPIALEQDFTAGVRTSSMIYALAFVAAAIVDAPFRKLYATAATCLACGMTTAVWAVDLSVGNLLLACMVGVFAVLGNYQARMQPMVWLGVLQTLASVVGFLGLSINFVHLNHWALFAAIGIALIVGATVVERQRRRIARWMRAWQRHFAAKQQQRQAVA